MTKELPMTKTFILLSFFLANISCAQIQPDFREFSHQSEQETHKGLNAFLSGYDGAQAVNQDVTLKAKLEGDGIIPYRRDIPDEEVHFYLDGKMVGKAITDEEGMAVFHYGKLSMGSHRFEASLHPKSDYRSNKAELFHVVIHPEKKVIISDIDHTISNASAWEVLVKPNSKIKPLKNAAKSIHYFQKSGFQVVYLTARDDTFLLKTKEWLNMHHFPKAPSYYWDFNGDGIPNDHGDYKSQVIAGLKKGLNKILIGVGDKPHDIRAYRDHGLRSYYIGKSSEEIDPDGIKIKSWDALLDHLASYPMGTLNSDPELL